MSGLVPREIRVAPEVLEGDLPAQLPVEILLVLLLVEIGLVVLRVVGGEIEVLAQVLESSCLIFV